MEQFLSALRRQGFVPADTSFSTGRPDRATVALTTPAGAPVVAKLYPGGKGEATFTNMQKIWRSSFGERRQPPGLPQPLDYLPELGAVIMERIEGRPLAERDGEDEPICDDCIRLLAELHECDAVPYTRRTSRGIVRSIQRKVERIASLAPQHAGAVCEAFGALEAARVKDRELVPSHGDFSPKNVLAGPGRLTLIDWDRFQWADPARDLACMATWSWLKSLRRGQSPDRAPLKRVVAVYQAARPGARLGKQLRFHVAAVLLRRAHSLVELWPQDTWLVPVLAKAALRELE